MADLFGSDFTLIGATVAGLALTLLAILHDLGPLRLNQSLAAALATQEDPQ